MPDRAVVNASPLIFLAQADLLDLLHLAGDEIIVPTAVAEEILRRGPADITAQAITQTPWLVMIEAPPVPPAIQAWGWVKANHRCWLMLTRIPAWKRLLTTWPEGVA